MSTKDSNNKGKDSSSSGFGSFDDFEASFFSEQPQSPSKKTSESSKISATGNEEESSEDFGYEGEVEQTVMPLDDGSDATDVFNREAYDELLDELDAQGDVADVLEDSSEDTTPPLELVSNFRMKPKSTVVENSEVTDSLLSEFSAELGEPLIEDTEQLESEPASGHSAPIEDDLLDMAFSELDFDSPLDGVEEAEIDEESGEFLSEIRSDSLLDEAVETEKAETTVDLEPASVAVGDDDSTDVFDAVAKQAETVADDGLWDDEAGLDALTEETFDGWVDPAMKDYSPRGEQEYYQQLRELFMQESKLIQPEQDKQYLWAECARISAEALRDDTRALELFAQANKGESGILRNTDLKLYADVAARDGQTRLYLDVLQQWALERDGALAAEAWGDIAIFLQKRFGNVDTALDAIKRAIDADPEDWLNWQFLCQIQEATQQWDDLQDSLAHLEQLSSGPLAAQYAHRQALVALHRQRDSERGLTKLRDAIEHSPHLQATLDLLQIGVQVDDSETILLACEAIWRQLDSSSDRLLWALHLYNLSHGAYGRDKILGSIDIGESIESFWLYLALLEASDVEERKRVLLEATTEEREDLALIWFHLSLLFEQEDDERAGEALIKTIELDPFAIIAVDDYVEHLIAKEAFEECVDWLCNLYETVLSDVPEVALAYLAQAAFIADAYLQDSIRAANMLSQAAAEDSELGYLAETLYLRGEHWEALIEFYKKRASKATEPAESAHWMIQGGIIAETRLNQVEQAEELYAMAREKSPVAKIGITDVLRLRIRSGDWQEVVDIISEQADQAIDPAGMYFMAANVSHCLLQNQDGTINNLKACLRHAPSHVAALLLLRRVSSGEDRLWANRELLKHLDNKNIRGWLQWENSNQPGCAFDTSSFEADSIFFLERLFTMLLSDVDVPVHNVLGTHPLVDTILLTKAQPSAVRGIVSRSESPTFGIVLFVLSLGESGLADELLGTIDSEAPTILALKAKRYERERDLESAEAMWLKVFNNEDLPMDQRITSALALDHVLRFIPERHLQLAQVHSTLASWLEDDSPVNYFALLAAQLFSSLGNVSEATDFYKLRFKKAPVLGKVFQGLKRLFLQTHNVADMQELLTELDELVLLDFAEIMEEFREYGQAAESYERLLNISKEQGLSSGQLLPYYARMERCYEKSGNWSAVLRALEEQRDLVASMEFQHHLDSKIQWVLVEHLADSDLALETYQRMLDNDPTNRTVLKALAKIAIQHNQVADAIDYLNILAENPTDVSDAIQIMSTLVEAHQANGDRDKEIEVLTDIIDLDSNNTEAMDQLADCLQERGDWQELFTLLQRRSMISEEHDKVACHTRIARLAEERLLDIDLALKEWSKVYELLGPEEETLRRLIHLSKTQFDTASFLHYADELIGLLEGEAKAQLCMEVADAYINELLEDNKAVPYLEVALLENSTFARAAAALENQYQIMSEWQKLLDLLLHKESMLNNVSEQVEVLLRAAEIAEISLQQDDQADEIFLRIQQLDPTNAGALKRAANALYKSEQWSELLALYQEHAQVFRDGTRSTVDMLIRTAEAGSALEKWSTAVDALEQVLEMVPTHLYSLQMLSMALQQMGKVAESIEIDLRLLEVMGVQGEKENLAEVCLRLGNSNLGIGEWATALKYFQKSRIYAPKDARSLKGIIECSWQKSEFSRVAQLCSTLVKNATDEQDVVLGYLWRGFTLDAKLQRKELAEQHYWRVLEYNQNHPVTLLYLSGISYRKNKLKSMLGQLSQAWEQTDMSDDVRRLVAVGRYLAAKGLDEEALVQQTSTWLQDNQIAVGEDTHAQWLEQLGERLFGI